MAAPRFTLSKPGLLLSVILGAFCTVWGFLWTRQGMTAHELVANVATVNDFFNMAAILHHTGGNIFSSIPWWTPNYTMGQTLAPYWSSITSCVGILLGELIGAPLHDPSSGVKIVCLNVIFFSGIGMYLFIKRLTDCPWSAFAAGILYATCPQLTLQFAQSEHITLGFGFLFPPFILWSCLGLSRSRSWFFVLLLALSSAMLTLIFIRAAAGFLPLVVLFLIWLAVADRQALAHLAWGLPRAGVIYIFLAVLPNLPMMKESAFLTLFSMSPLEGWQETFSFKTAVSWLSRNSMAFEGGPQLYTVESGGFYLGFIPLLAFTLLFLQKGKIQDAIYETREGTLIRLFIAIGLVLTQLSCGPKCILSGQIAFLRDAATMPNWSAVLSDFLVLIQGYIIYRLFPPVRYRWLYATIAIIFYFLISSFQIFTHVPPYDTIRAPWFFWEMSGSVCLAAAGGIAFVFLYRQWIAEDWRSLLAWPIGILAIAILFLDLYPYEANFNQGTLGPPNLFHDFDEVVNCLNKEPRPGRVMFESGRYFFLLTPLLTNRGLADEAFHSYLMSKWSRQIVEAGRPSIEFLRPQLSFMGITYIIMEKRDPDIPPQFIDSFRANFPVKFENDCFVIFENGYSLSPYFYVKDIVAVQTENPAAISNIISLANLRYAPMFIPGVENQMPDLAGRLDDNGIQMFPAYKDKNGELFVISQRLIDRPDPHTMYVLPPPEGYTGIVIPESYHPSWHAYANGRPIPVYRSFGCLIGALVPPGTTELYFKFEPPAWYNLCIFTSFFAWLFTFSIFGGFALSYLIRPERAPLTFWQNPPPMLDGPDRTPVDRSIQNKAIVLFAHHHPESALLFLASVRAKLPGTQILFVTPAKHQDTLAAKIPSTPSQIVAVNSISNPLPELIQWAASHQIDALYLIPHDYSYSMDQMPKAVELFEKGVEVAIGTRYLGGIRINNWPFHRLLLSQIAATITRKVLALPLTDPRSRFIVLNRSALEVLSEMSFPQSPADHEWLGIILAAQSAGLIIEEFPVYYDATGDTTFPLGGIFRAMGRLIQTSLFKPRHIS